MRPQDARLFVQVGASAILLYTVLGLFAAPDLHEYLFPWLAHVREAGPVGAFSEPFSNYTPPYLYLIAATSLLGLPQLATIKLLSVLATLWLALSVRRLLIAHGSERHDEAAALCLLLPTVFLNGPFLGQCDALWVGCCIFAVAAAVEKRTYALAAWAGFAFAIKGQALFLAPFALAIVIRERNWVALVIPVGAYLLAITPAWLAGWPLDDLLTIYWRQYGYLNLLSSAPNIWALPAMFQKEASPALILISWSLTAAAVALFVWRFPGKMLLAAALLSAIVVPWLLPKMHERYFLLADMLALCLAYVDRRGIQIFVMVQFGSFLSLLAYGTHFEPFNVAGSIAMTAGLVATIRLVTYRARGPSAPDQGEVH